MLIHRKYEHCECENSEKVEHKWVWEKHVKVGLLWMTASVSSNGEREQKDAKERNTEEKKHQKNKERGMD